MTLITLTPPARQSSTAIHIGPGVRSKIRNLVDGFGSFGSVVILSDRGVRDIADTVELTIPGAKRIEVASGDASKCLAETERITSEMLKMQCDRSTLLVCVGGGMITDLGGFIASIYMRGIACVSVPTTMLGMVDAAIGGKTGVNLGEAKNMIGIISHPRAVIIDTELVDTLPEPQLREGLVEVIKIAAVADAQFFAWLEQLMGDVLKREPKAIHECVERAATLKSRIVEQDEQDTFARLALNFGHTVGHAVETASGFRLSHGAAVSIGIAAELTIAKSPARERITALLAKIGMPLTLPAEYSAEQLWKLMRTDKKNAAGQVRFAVPTAIGESHVRALSEAEFLSLFA